MTTFDFSPLFRSTIGFDRLAGLLEANARRAETIPNYPPYDIEVTGEDAYRISIALAGFAAEDLNLEEREGVLTVVGERRDEDDRVRYLHRGIATRAFERRFQLADHVLVAGATLRNGTLDIDLVREVPEEMKPRRIAITNVEPAGAVSKAKKLVTGETKAA